MAEQPPEKARSTIHSRATPWSVVVAVRSGERLQVARDPADEAHDHQAAAQKHEGVGGDGEEAARLAHAAQVGERHQDDERHADDHDR